MHNKRVPRKEPVPRAAAAPQGPCAAEIPLPGGRTTEGVAWVGDTVRRAIRGDPTAAWIVLNIAARLLPIPD